MIDATPILRAYATWRGRRLARQDAVLAQRRTLRRLLARAARTRFGRDHGFASIRDPDGFAERVPLRRYEDFWRDYWQPQFPRLVDVCWPGLVPFFAASSGTTTGTSKFIPVTAAMLRANRRAALDLLVHHLANRPRSHILAGRALLLGGSTALAEEAAGVRSGDLSGIAAATVPPWARPLLFPRGEIARLADWREKLARLVELAPAAEVSGIAGMPSWLLLFFDQLAARHPQRRPLLADFFPDLELVIHGGVNFAPYRARFAEWLAGGHAELREIYAASEGFVAAADRGDGEGLRLVADHGIFWEFVPVEEIAAARPVRHWLAAIEPGVEYAIALSSCAGLFAYVVGDTVRFLSRDPPRLVVTGRLAYTLSAFGEHLIDAEIEAAVAAAAAAIGAAVRDFAVAPLYPERIGEVGGHLWIVEFERPVGTAERRYFAEFLDADLSRRNADYGAHRADGFGLRMPQIAILPPGGFAAWLDWRGRLGGQNKVPRILTDRQMLRELRELAAMSY